jgi:hypothetical protein
MQVNAIYELLSVLLAKLVLNAAGVVTQVYDEESREDDPFVSATVQEPYIVLRTNTGKVSVYHGDAAAMTLKRLYRPPDGETVSAVNEFMM